MSLPDQSALRPRPCLGRKATVLAAALALALVAGPALAATGGAAPPGYPASAEARDVLPWLVAHTSVRPGAVIVISPQAVVSLDRVTRGADKTAPIAATVREELIDARLAERLHVRSTRLELDLDCAASLYRVRENTRFTLPDLKGDAVKKPAGDLWARLEDGTALFKVASVACAPGKAGPEEKTASPPVSSQAPAPARVSPGPPLPKAETPHPSPAPTGASQAVARAGPSFKVLLGSYSIEGNAHAAVADLTRGFPEPIKGRDVVVRKTSVKGKDYFAVAVLGFAARTDASAFCKAVHADDCLIRH